MCGIFGFVKTSKASPEIILNGLKLLEYRGYDSWGIAVKVDGNIEVEKNVGKIGDAKISLPESEIGIGHTRWATHGGVTNENSHPHLDCYKNIAVVHNGIIENYIELKEDLIKKGHKFVSETDTEVFPHLIEEFENTFNFENAFKNAFNAVKGLNAVVAISSKTKEIAAAKTGSPLIVGIEDNGFYISSDPSAISIHTKKALFLKDNEMVILGSSLRLYELPSGSDINPSFETLESNSQSEDLGKFKHFMIKEIYDQPKVLDTVSGYEKEIEKLAEEIRNAFGTFFIGAGTAYYAALAGSYLFSKIAKVHVNHSPASEFNYLEDFLKKKSLIIALSQSGETIDVVEPLQRAKNKGSKIAALVNVKGSSIYRMSDLTILLGAGTERAVASTKAYISKLAVLLLLSYALKNDLNTGKKLILNASKEIERILNDKNLDNIKKIASFLNTKEHIYIIGRGISYPSALEAALKIREVSYIHAEGIAGGELKHGAIALISKGTPVIVFAPNDETYSAIISNAMEIKARGGVIIGIGFKEADVFDYFIEVKDTSDAFVISQVVPVQLLSYYLAIMKSYDPDKPRNLAKSVTVK